MCVELSQLNSRSQKGGILNRDRNFYFISIKLLILFDTSITRKDKIHLLFYNEIVFIYS